MTANISRSAERLGLMVALLTLMGGNLIMVGADVSAAAGADANPFAGLRLPEIAVTITNDAFVGVPSELAAGRYVLSVTNQFNESDEETAGAAFLRLPEAVSAGEFMSIVQDDNGSDWPADWYYTTALAGGPYAALGESAYAVIDLTAGEWVLWGEAPGSPQDPIAVTVSGAPPADPPAPAADATITLSDFSFTFSGPLRSGPRIIEVVNLGEQPHFVFVGGVPDGATVTEAQAAFEAFWNPDTAPAGAFSFAESPELLGVGDQSAGATTWHAVDLPPGTAVFACFVTDPETREPHAMLGMTETVVIE